MIPDRAATEGGGDATRPPRVTRADDAYLGDDEGIGFWRGFDASSIDTQVFLARARCEPGTRIPPHWHSHDTVAYLTEGRATFRSGADLDEVLELAKGDWLFVPAGAVHVEQTPDDSHADFLYARDGRGGTTTYLDDVDA